MRNHSLMRLLEICSSYVTVYQWRHLAWQGFYLVEGAIKECWGFEATLFVDIEFRKSTIKSKYLNIFVCTG